MAGDRIKTKWADEINIAEVLPEYPRPIMVRDDWKNLNGLWDYAITEVGKPGIPTSFDGQILVPFAVESSLSGVGKTVGAKRGSGIGVHSVCRRHGKKRGYCCILVL